MCYQQQTLLYCRLRILYYFSATVKFSAEKFAPSSDMTTGPSTSAAADLSDTKKIILNSGEELFAELRDRNFHAVGPILSKKAKLISAEFDVGIFVLLVKFYYTFVP